MRLHIVTALVTILPLACVAQPVPAEDADVRMRLLAQMVENCRQEPDTDDRLSCYDRWAPLAAEINDINSR